MQVLRTQIDKRRHYSLPYQLQTVFCAYCILAIIPLLGKGFIFRSHLTFDSRMDKDTQVNISKPLGSKVKIKDFPMQLLLIVVPKYKKKNSNKGGVGHKITRNLRFAISIYFKSLQFLFRPPYFTTILTQYDVQLGRSPTFLTF